MSSGLPSKADIVRCNRHVSKVPKTDNRLIMTAEQGSQTEREPGVAGKQWPTGVRRGIRRSSDRLLVLFLCRWALPCRLIQRDARESPGSIQGQCPEPNVQIVRFDLAGGDEYLPSALTSWAHRLQGVENGVEDNLLKLDPITCNNRQVGHCFTARVASPTSHRRVRRSRHRNSRDLISRRCARGARAKHNRPRSARYASSRGRPGLQPGRRHSPTSTDSRRVRDKCADQHKRARLRKRPKSRPQREPITSSSW